MVDPFLPRNIPWTMEGQMLSMLSHGQEVRSWMDYILGTDRRMFQILAVRSPMHNTYQCLVLGCLRGVTLKYHQRYLGLHTQIPLFPPNHSTNEDSLFASLRQAVPKTPVRKRTHASWILEETGRVIDTRASLRRSPDRNQRRLCNLGRRVRSLLARNRRRQATNAGTAVGNLFLSEPPPGKEYLALYEGVV